MDGILPPGDLVEPLALELVRVNQKLIRWSWKASVEIARK